MYEIVKGYQKNAKIRHSFNELAVETFNLSFEDWYQNGFWGDNYIPYSIVIDEKVVANVSVNITNMMYEGEKKQLIQLGTVMTDKEHRNKGFIRQIMEQIELDYNNKVEGVYLFANDSVLDFYPKFGFKQSTEYQHSTQVMNNSESHLEQVSMNNNDEWKSLLDVMNQNVFHGKFDMVGNNELIMFYVTKFMQKSVYYHHESDTFIIADIEGENAFIHNIFSKTISELDKVISLFGTEVKSIILGFTPMKSEKYQATEIKEEDTTFFIKGEFLEFISKKQMRIPSLAHA